MAKQTFTTGQVLTAAQMTSLQQTAMGGGSTTAKTVSYVLVAADAGTVVQMNSASATTITVNTALFAAGDTVQIQNVGAGVCTVTAGTATVSTSATLALKQYDAGSLYFNSTSAAIFFAVDAADGMANVLTTTGDMVYSSSGTTAARLGIGSTAQVLTVAAGIPSWATPASAGSYTSLATGSLTGSSVSITSISGSYKELRLQATGFSFSTSSEFRFTINSATSQYGYTTISNGTASGTGSSGVAFGSFGGSVATYSDNANVWLSIPFYATASRPQWIGGIEGVNGSNGAPQHSLTFGGSNNSAAVTSIQLFPQTGTFSSGTYTLWGVA